MKVSQRSSTYERVWFITGSSAGLGRALTEAVLARGERAVVTARTPERVRDLIERYPAQALVLGLVDVTRAVLPAMQRASSGHIVNVLSGVPSRRAVEGFSAALADELAPLGIEVITIEPGSANGHQTDDPAAVVEAIIGAVDADAAEIGNRRTNREVT